jgi:hypothetical protein
MVNAPAPRSAPLVWTGTQVLVWGGYDSVSSNMYLQSGGRYDPETDSWTPTSTGDAPVGRWGHAAVWTGNVMVVWGGARAGTSSTNTGGRYDPLLDDWAPTSTLNAPSRRYLHTAVWTGSRMVVWGGRLDLSYSEYYSTGGRYDPVADTWSPTSPSGVTS